jgi:ATP-dependent Clp protease protease subunit
MDFLPVEPPSMNQEPDIDFKSRSVYLFGEINEAMACKFIKAIHKMDKTKGKIIIYLNSGGGCVDSGMAMFDTIKMAKNTIVIKVVGVAMSMAAVLLQSADERLMSTNSRLMVHIGSIQVGGHVKDVERAMADSRRIDGVINEILYSKVKAKKTRLTKKDFEKETTEFDRYFSAQEALDWGLVDGLI